MRAKGFDVSCRVMHREQLFDLLGERIGDRRVLYLEFGVHRGESVRYWSKLLRHPESRLHGFDSFEGLPETWNPRAPKGHFTTGGVVPAIDDRRVTFFRGWFQDTLPTYQAPPHDTLVVNIDCDLYSSTISVLNAVHSLIKPGTYIYFDEFFDRAHEMRAFDEFLSSSQLRFRLMAADVGLVRAVFECV
jgi:hypothetical protein